MSCFQVSKAHICAILYAYRHHERGSWPVGFYHDGQRVDFGDSMSRDTWGAVGAVLWNANRASVSERYEEDIDPDPFTVADVQLAQGHVTPVVILKALDCLEYQSCDWEGWEGSLARTITDTIRRAIVRALPGYAGAPWAIDSLSDPNLYRPTGKASA